MYWRAYGRRWVCAVGVGTFLEEEKSGGEMEVCAGGRLCVGSSRVVCSVRSAVYKVGIQENAAVACDVNVWRGR